MIRTLQEGYRRAGADLNTTATLARTPRKSQYDLHDASVEEINRACPPRYSANAAPFLDLKAKSYFNANCRLMLRQCTAGSSAWILFMQYERHAGDYDAWPIEQRHLEPEYPAIMQCLAPPCRRHVFGEQNRHYSFFLFVFNTVDIRQ